MAFDLSVNPKLAAASVGAYRPTRSLTEFRADGRPLVSYIEVNTCWFGTGKRPFRKNPNPPDRFGLRCILNERTRGNGDGSVTTYQSTNGLLLVAKEGLVADGSQRRARRTSEQVARAHEVIGIS